MKCDLKMNFASFWGRWLSVAIKDNASSLTKNRYLKTGIFFKGHVHKKKLKIKVTVSMSEPDYF